MMKFCYVSVFAATVVAMSGCRTNKDILNDYEKALTAGDYQKPIIELEEKADGGGVDELMWRLHAGGSQYLVNNHYQTVYQFDKAEDTFAAIDGEGAFGKATDTAFAMMTNDRAFPFSGSGNDRVFTCLYKAIDYVAAGDNAAARTELNRAAQHQDNWLFERKKEIEEAEKRLEKDAQDYAKKENSQSKDDDTSKAKDAADKAMNDATFGAMIKEKCNFDPAADGNLETLSRQDWLNVYAEHVTGVFRWLNGEDDASVYLKEAAEVKVGNNMLMRDAAEVQSGVKPKDQVWVFVEDGLCPMREEWRIDLPLVLIPYANRFVMYAGMALPYLRYRDFGMNGYEVIIGGKAQTLEVLEDVDRLSKNEFDVYFRGALTREIIRTIVKVGIQVGFGVAAETTNDSKAKLAFRIAQVSAAAYAASVTQADLRSWTGLPKKVYAVRCNRPADGRIVVAGTNGTPVTELNLPDGNSLVFVRKPSAAAPAVVKVANFK